MRKIGGDPLAYFGRWLSVPIDGTDRSAAGMVRALGEHPMARDETAQDYVMPLSRCREHPGRFRLFGENQDTYYCFVQAGDETRTDAPVYFESCLDLTIDYGFDRAEIVDGDHVLVADVFADFLWHMLGHHLCIRMEAANHFADGVNGVVFSEPIELGGEFMNPLGREFPAGYTCWFGEDVVCAPDWGAAFRTAVAREAFLGKYSPGISRSWGAGPAAIGGRPWWKFW